MFPHFQAQPGILELDRWFRFISGARDPSGPELLTFQVSKKKEIWGKIIDAQVVVLDPKNGQALGLKGTQMTLIAS